MTIRALTPQECAALEKANGWRQGCPIGLNRLHRIEILYVDFDGHTKYDGKIDVLDAIAPAVESIFQKLYDKKFPLALVKPIEAFGADPMGPDFGGNDMASMDANNCHGFNHRRKLYVDELSIHSFGCAIDINPVQNPYAIIDAEKSLASIYPKAGCEFLNRNNQRPGMVEPIVSLMRAHGFTIWGGDWNAPLDYHHFQLTRELAGELAQMDADAAQRKFAALF